ncbi:hypothetical protein JQC67_16515 [Aurantibacter crassamenti]|uniref:hypothetical protein n=1 Tax=Aurantibacter crassamenti TaxID=1837375 RepID=UPI00193957B1|nr:hypothetical protein [Aurantibacter crassamenti]MBM1107761.1 hypothetical protein [Aurantibacter crassamenti]
MKVFRKLRRKLLLSGKIKSYLIYALGEILLIVIGILIAWKINSLNEIRKNRIVELKIYKSLSQELDTNLLVLDSAIIRYSDSIEKLKNTLNYLGEQPNELTVEAKDLIVNLNYTKVIIRNESINSINITNKFEFIESDSLKELIAIYPNELDKFDEQENRISDIITYRLKPVIEKHVSLIDLLPEDSFNYKRIKRSSKESNYSDLLDSKEYQNSVIDRLLQTKTQLAITENLKHKTKSIAIKLNQELKGS